MSRGLSSRRPRPGAANAASSAALPTSAPRSSSARVRPWRPRERLDEGAVAVGGVQAQISSRALSGSRAAFPRAAGGRGAGCRRCAGGCSRASPAGDQPGLVGPVDADVAAGGPVGQRGRLRARPEGDRPVERAGVAREAVADVEGAGRSGGRGAPDPDRGPEHGAPVAQQRQGQPRAIDDQPRVHLLVAAERRARQPPGLRPARGQARADPQAAVRIAGAPEDEHEVRRVLGRVRASRATRARPADGAARAIAARRSGAHCTAWGSARSGSGAPIGRPAARGRGDVGDRGARRGPEPP